MFQTKKIISFLLVFALFFSVGTIGGFAAETSPEEQNLQKAITEGQSNSEDLGIEISEEEANSIVQRLNEEAEVIEVEVTRPSTTLGASAQAVDVAVVKTRPTYGFTKVSGATGRFTMHLEIWVQGGGVSALISRVQGYAAFATNVEGIREDFNHLMFPPLKRTFVTEDTNIRINFDTNLLLWDGFITVSLLGGWSDAHVSFDYEDYL